MFETHSSLAPLRQQPWGFGGVEAASRLLLEGAAALAALVQPQASQRTPAPAAQQEPESAVQPSTTHSVGEAGTLEHRLFIRSLTGATVSPWHDIPLYLGSGAVSFVCEIPRESRAKLEVAVDEAQTPIKQDVKNGKLRVYPWNIHWHYGMLPQTWEDPAHASASAGRFFGDGDPLDAVIIGSAHMAAGGVYAVKPLAVFAMIDEGELDWKVVAVRADDPAAAAVSDVEDVERRAPAAARRSRPRDSLEFPGELERIRVWFRDYKIPSGKTANAFAFEDRPQNKAFTLKVIAETHGFYKTLKAGQAGGRLSLA